MATNSQAKLFEQLLEKYEPEVRKAFYASVEDLQSHVDWNMLINRLEANDIEGAIAALNISNAAWDEYSASVTSIFAAAGAATVAQIVRKGIGGIATRFSMANYRVDQWLRENISERVNGFTNESLSTAREVIQEGLASGSTARTIAADLAGRPAGSGARIGGFLGLDRPRAERFIRVVVGMRTAEGVQSLVTKHLDGSLSVNYKVNEATAQRILRAYKSGTAVPSTDRLISERQYKNALLKARAETIAETQASSAISSSRDEVWRQLIDSGIVDDRTLVKKWKHKGQSEFYREYHLLMSGNKVYGIETPFIFGDGGVLRYPHDPRGGAKHVINCQCELEYSIDLSRV